ncbi:MAG: ABC transporter permease [Anaerolineaceae bacterium]|nr:ABC transporter permease [Anaerolineaceae bacterium]
MNNKSRSFNKIIKMQETGILLIIIVFAIVITLINPVFIAERNIANVLRSTGFTLLTTLGMTLVLISGGIDLSVGSVYALAGTVCAKCLLAGLPIWISILLGLISGFLVGLVNGLIIVKLNIPPLIVTLGMMYIARGIVYVTTQGVPVYPLPDQFKAIEHYNLFNSIPSVIVIALILAIIINIVLRNTPFGRAVFAVGGNWEAARISGIDDKKIKLAVYSLTSTLAALTGIMMASRLGSSQSTMGTGYEMTVISAAIIGGTSTYGGVGTILGSILGALFIEMLSNSLTLARISVFWQSVVIGVVLVMAVIIDTYRRKLIRRKEIGQTR